MAGTLEKSLVCGPYSDVGRLYFPFSGESHTMYGGDLEKVGRTELHAGVPGVLEDRSTQ